MTLNRRASVRSLILLVALIGAASRASATDVRSVLTGFNLTTWNEKDGLPDGNIYVLAQDGEGYLWVGTEAGPYRFDGVRFTPWRMLVSAEAPARAVRALHAARDGSMWIGFGGQGGIAVFDRGRVRVYGTADGLPPATVSTILEFPAGSFWAGTSLGLFRLDGARWTRVGADQGVPEEPVLTGTVTRDGRLIVGAGKCLLDLDPASRRFVQVAPLTEEPRAVVEGPRGELIVSDQVAGYRIVGSPGVTDTVVERGRGRVLIRDRRDNLWVGTAGQGVWRIRFDEAGGVQLVEHAAALTGLPADGVIALHEDREGNIWAGTPEGISRLTPYKVAQVTNVGLVAGVEPAGNGALWVGTVDDLLQMTRPDVRSQERRLLRGARLRALHTDAAGTLWVGTDQGLGRLAGSALMAVPVGAGDVPRQIDSITSDADGGLWLFDAGLGLLRWKAGRLSAVALPEPVRGQRVEATLTDSVGRVWIAFSNGIVAIAHEGAMALHGPADGLHGGVYQAIFEDQSHVVWLGGTTGLSRYADGRFATVPSGRGFPVGNLTAIVEDARGELWFGSGTGVLQMPRAELARLFEDPAYRPHYLLLDRSDGLAGLPFVYSRNRRAIRAGDGRLWFVTGRGLTVVDPAELGAQEHTGPVRIEGALADGVRTTLRDGMAFAAGTSRLEFEFTSVNLTSPFRQRFRYQLEGFDSDWVDGGARRQAFYTNLPPRPYRFRVMSTNAKGDWMEPGAVLAFSIRPMFYQTGWFLAAVLAVVALVVGGAWRLHVRRVRRRFALLIGERARLSRELHDTLLQSLVGIALQFDAMANDPQFSFSREQKQEFVRMRRRVEEYMREARQSIADLRSPRIGTHDLSAALRDAAERAIDGHPITFSFEQVGAPQPIPTRIEEELLKIGREAIGNAVRHAGADRIAATLEYAPDALTLRVIDDGAGFDAQTQAVAGHYGLTSMRERAEDVGGRLTIQSGTGRGTRVEAIVPLQHPRRRSHAEIPAH